MYLPQPTGTDFSPPPAGTHLATCYRVIDLGTQQTEFNGQQKFQHKIMIGWELPHELMDDGRPFTISQRYTFSMSEKANLRHHLESWRGKPFEERDFGEGGFHMSKIIGKACMLGVIHSNKNGKTYANISAVMALPKGQTPAPLINEAMFFSLGEFKQDVFDKLSEGLRGVIQKSPEYQEIMRKLNGGHEETASDRGYDDLDGEIPF